VSQTGLRSPTERGWPASGAFTSRRGPGEGSVDRRGRIRQARRKLLNADELCIEFLDRPPCFPGGRRISAVSPCSFIRRDKTYAPVLLFQSQSCSSKGVP
jgi:hypothetical protein